MSRRRFSARRIDDGDRATWSGLARSHGTVFDSLPWLELTGIGAAPIGLFDASDELRGGFCLREEVRAGLRIARNPVFTPTVGPFLAMRSTNPVARISEFREALEAMVEYLSDRHFAIHVLGLRPGIQDPTPFFRRGWKVVSHITYRLNLEHSIDDLFDAMSPDRRKSIRKAETLGFDVEFDADGATLVSLVDSTFARQGRPWPREIGARIVQDPPPGLAAFTVVASQGGRALAGAFVVHDHSTAYYLMGGYADDAGHAAGPLVMWHAIQKAKSLGLKVFDFEGSMIPEIERYFRGFGGALTPYFTVNRAWFPIEVVLKARFRNRF